MAADGAPPTRATAADDPDVWYTLIEEGRPLFRRVAASEAAGHRHHHRVSASPRSLRAGAIAFRWSSTVICLGTQLVLLKAGVLNGNSTGEVLLGVLDLLLCFGVPAMGYAYGAQLDQIAEEKESLVGN